MECSLFTMWGRGLKMSDIPADALYDAVKSVPARPTISNLQWIMGTQYIRVDDLNLLSKLHLSHIAYMLVGGPDRPLSKTQAAQQYAQDRQRVLADRAVKRSNTASSQDSASSSQGIFAQMQQSLSERGVRLDGIQEQFSQLGEASQEWYESLGKTVESQKRKYLPSSLLRYS